MSLNDLNNAQYIALETFRKSGQGVITPVWQAADGGKLYVWTVGASGKVKRIRANGRVRLCASDVRGNPTGPWMEAQARVLDQPAQIKATEKRIAAKYGLLFHVFGLMGRLRGQKNSHVALEISPAPAS